MVVWGAIFVCVIFADLWIPRLQLPLLRRLRRLGESGSQDLSPIGSMVLLYICYIYMVTWIPSIYPKCPNVSINIPAPWILYGSGVHDSWPGANCPTAPTGAQGATSLANVVATLCISTDTPMSQQFWESVTLRTTRPQSTTRPREAPRKTAISIITKQLLYTLHWFADFLTCHVTTIRF